jgi:translation elongation factor EF-Ts
MHIAALDPRYVRREEVTPEILEREREIYMEQARATGKPEPVIRENRQRQDGKVLRGELPLRTALHQG